MAVDHNNPQSRDEEILIATIDGKEYNKNPQSRMEELLLELKETIEEGGGGGGTTNYENLSNQPQVNGETLIGDKSGSDLGLVDAEEGKGLSTNDYDDKEKAAVAAATSAIAAMKDGSELDSFGDVEVALLDKADISDLGTAAAKDSTNAVISGSTDLVESGAVKDAIDAAVAAAYHHAGTKTVAQLTHDLLVAANEGNVYNITDSGTTTSDFIEGIGKTIDEGSNVGICKVGNVYMFDLLSGFVDTTNFVQKSQTTGLLKNDGTVDTTIEDDIDSLKSGFTTLDNEVNGDATVYPYADVITIPDSIPSNLANCNVKIEPVQDLHGYDKPWVGGAWKNKCKSRSASATSNGVEFTLNDDGTVTANRTSTSENNAYVVLPSVTLPAGTYKFSGCNGGFDTGYWIDFSYNSTSHRQYTEELTATFTEETTVTPWLNVYVSYNAQNKVFSPMIRIDGTTSTYEPYENICPITGHTEARVQRDGVNLLNSTKFARKNPDSGDASNNWAIWEDYIRCNYNNSLTLNCGIGHVQIYRIIVNCFDKYMNHLGNISETYIYGDGYTFTINIAGTKYCRVQLYNATSMADYDFSTAQLEYGSTATPYVPYAGQTYTIALGDTIYGGTVDFNSGVMTVTHQITDLGDYNYTKQTIINNTTLFYTNFDVVTNAKYGDIDYKGTSLCSSFDYASARTVAEGNAETINVGYSDSHRLRICTKVYESYTESDFKTAVTGQKLCYELATPTPIQLTPQQIQLLKGQNTLTASTGQISVTVNGVSGSIGAVQEQVNEIASDKQDKTDNTLTTTAKTVVGGINELKSSVDGLTANQFATYEDISSYTADKYQFENDGYVLLATNSTSSVEVRIYGRYGNDYFNASSINGINVPVYVRKGMRLLVNSTSGTSAVVRFYPLEV